MPALLEVRTWLNQPVFSPSLRNALIGQFDGGFRRRGNIAWTTRIAVTSAHGIVRSKRVRLASSHGDGQRLGQQDM